MTVRAEGTEMIDEQELRGLGGHEVVDCDGKSIGYVDQIFSNRKTGEPEWIGVITGTFRRQTHLVPVSGLETRNGTLKIPWTKDRVKHAPAYAGGGGILGVTDYRPEISESEERAAYAYYGRTENQ
jgi:sporulation protein YlmC with PRC-barrel domain